MTAPVAYAVPKTVLGIAKEVTRGTPVNPAYWMKVKAPKYKPDLTMIEDDTLQGSMVKVYDTIPGLRKDDHGWDGFLYMDTLPLLMMAELGSTDTATAATAATTLNGGVAVGATTIVTTASTIPNGALIIIGVIGSAVMETNYVLSGGLTANLTLLFPLNYAHLTGVAVTPLNTHAMSLLNNAGTGNQPPSLTITDYDGEEYRQLAAAQLDKLTLKGNATGLADYSTSFMANPSITPGGQSPAPSAIQAPPGWTAMINIGGVNYKYVVDWEVDLARNVKPIPALTGTQAYMAFFADAMTCPGKITVIEQAGAPELALYEAGTASTLDILIYDRLNGNAMYLHSSKTKFKSGEIDRSKSWVEVPLGIDLLPTATDALAGGVSPLKTVFGNGQSAAY
jgi:hypothetical protein